MREYLPFSIYVNTAVIVVVYADFMTIAEAVRGKK